MKNLTRLICICLLILSSNIYACSCEFLTLENLKDYVSDADSVILGVPNMNSEIMGDSDYGEIEVKTEMNIVRSFKGPQSKSINLYSWKDNGGNCGIDFKKYDGLYLLFSYLEEGKYVTSICDVENIDPSDEELSEIINHLSSQF